MCVFLDVIYCDVMVYVLCVGFLCVVYVSWCVDVVLCMFEGVNVMMLSVIL